MKLFPYANLNFKTGLSKADALKQLNANVEPKKFLRGSFEKNHKLYEGEVNEDKFSIMPIARYARKYTMPVKGSIKMEIGGSIVNAKVRLSVWGYISMLIMIAIILLFIFIDLVQPIFLGTTDTINYANEITVIIGVGGFFLVLYFLWMIHFWRLYHQIKKDFCTFFKTEQVEEPGFRWERDRGFD